MKYNEILKSNITNNMKVNIEDNTFNEIRQQSETLLNTFKIIKKQKTEIEKFWANYASRLDIEIVLTGAGSSAFIGESVVGLANIHLEQRVRAIATTEILTNPDLFFKKNSKILLVSFARSGDSPESKAVVDLMEKRYNDISHIFITCNEEGSLLKSSTKNKPLRIVLPMSNDKGLAMTSSFTSMLAAFILMLKIENLSNEFSKISDVSKWIKHITHNNIESIKQIVSFDFERAVFLGSGNLLGIARECQLKLQELSDGIVCCKHDSFLGFRHGPKAVLNEKTIVIYLLSEDDNIKKYEEDLIYQLEESKVAKQILISGNRIEGDININFDLEILTSEIGLNISEDYLGLAYVIVGQLLGYFKSRHLGLNPDNPSVSGKISRVVEGFKIH